jgi:hypothetical protein
LKGNGGEKRADGLTRASERLKTRAGKPKEHDGAAITSRVRIARA